MHAQGWGGHKRGVLVAIWLLLGLFGQAASVSASSCTVPSRVAGVPVPVQALTPEWTCRIHDVVAEYTTADRVGPIRVGLPLETMHFLLDRPDVAAALVNRLDLGLYKAEPRGIQEYWGSDGEGNVGRMTLVHQDEDTRLYYLEGTHDGRILPQMAGAAVVLIQMRAVTLPDGTNAIDAVVVSYLRLHNRLLSGLASLLRPMVGAMVQQQVQKAIRAALGLARAMRGEPARVLFEATDPPSLPDDAVERLRQALRPYQSPVLSPVSQVAP